MWLVILELDETIPTPTHPTTVSQYTFTYRRILGLRASGIWNIFGYKNTLLTFTNSLVQSSPESGYVRLKGESESLFHLKKRYLVADEDFPHQNIIFIFERKKRR